MLFHTLESEYANLWDAIEINSNRRAQAAFAVKRILQQRARYEVVARETGVPWFVIGVIHAMEADCDFDRHLHNGDPLSGRTRNIPRGRPAKGTPPFDWEDSAVDALAMKRLDKITDWTVERIAYELERYNGWGYRLHHPTTLSPYLWAGSHHYARGKYVADGVWSSTAVSQQMGAMVLLLQLSSMAAIEVRPPRPARAKASAPERHGRAVEAKLDNKTVGTAAGIGGATAAWLVHAAGAIPSWQTVAVAVVTLGLAAILVPRLWRFMNAR